jgi:Ser/Thr protein kinase RdoA (MazF antagonist)
MGNFAWGSAETQYFFELTPEKILDAVEASGFRVTGRCLTLNSMENRVYEVELELDEGVQPKTPSERFRIVKFYRPGRWTETQILEEHAFLKDLKESEIPAVAPLPFSDGRTLHRAGDLEIWYTVFPKVGGRSPDELKDDQLMQVGRLLGRMHNVGAAKPAPHRIELSPESYGIQNLKFLLDTNAVPVDVRARYQKVVESICDLTAPWFRETPNQRIHGDCHFGNLLWGGEAAFFVDFDDMVRGPCVQDFWLLIPGRDQESRRQMEVLLEGYEQMRAFDRNSLRLIEPLRALRFVHFNAWIAKRWQDPAFPRSFPEFGTPRYWQEQVADLEDQLQWITQPKGDESGGSDDEEDENYFVF